MKAIKNIVNTEEKENFIEEGGSKLQVSPSSSLELQVKKKSLDLSPRPANQHTDFHLLLIIYIIHRLFSIKSVNSRIYSTSGAINARKGFHLNWQTSPVQLRHILYLIAPASQRNASRRKAWYFKF